jgi:diguanylate cyclase (GGDEF)-like protein
MAVISHVDKEKLLSITQKVRTIVENSVLRKDDKELSVTISIGATISQENDTIESMIKRADTLLYQSKNQGRNQITMDL